MQRDGEIIVYLNKFPHFFEVEFYRAVIFDL